MKKNTKLLLTLTLVGTTLFSCGSSVTPINGAKFENQQTETVETFNIVNVTSDYAYLDGLPEKGEVGKTYTFRVSLKPGYHFNDKVTIICGENNVDVTFENGYYSFSMPSGDVSISIDVGATDFTITNTSMFIEKVMIDGEDDSEENVRSITAGTALKFETTPNDDFYFTEIKINGKVVEEGEDGFYHFTMPNRPVVISSDKIATPYNINVDKTTLTFSSLKVYTDNVTKQEITSAVKGDKVYLDFTYLSTETIKVKYTINVKTVVDEGENAEELVVTQVDDTDVYTFDMISNDITISIEEKDCTPYINSSIINKTWKAYNLYGSNNKIETKEYSSISSKSFTFSSDGTLLIDKRETTWNVDVNNPNHVTYPVSSGTKDVYFTDHLFITPFSDSNLVFNDAYAGLCSSEYTFHAFVFNSNYRIIWIEDETGTILENLFVKNNEVFANTVIKNEDGTLAIGSDITTTANLLVYNGEELICKIKSSVAMFTSAITTELDEYVSVVVTNADGEEITSAENGETITVQVSLSDEAPEGIVLRKINVISDNKVITTTSDETTENKYTFTMPISAVVIKATTKNNNKYASYPFLGEYLTYNLYNSQGGDKTFTSESGLTKWTFDAAGSVFKKGSYSTIEYFVDSVENEENGLLTAVDSTGELHGTIYYGGGLMVTPYSFGKTSFEDVLIGIRLPEGASITDVKVLNHFAMQSNKQTWASSFFVNDVIFGSIFCYENQVYTGVEFTFDEGSTRINSTSSYHVVRDGVTLFDVSNDVVTVHEN